MNPVGDIFQFFKNNLFNFISSETSFKWQQTQSSLSENFGDKTTDVSTLTPTYI